MSDGQRILFRSGWGNGKTIKVDVRVMQLLTDPLDRQIDRKINQQCGAFSRSSGAWIYLIGSYPSFDDLLPDADEEA